jgi:hypothetical protein
MAETVAERRPLRLRVERARKRAPTTPARLRRLSLSIAVTAITLAVVGSGALVASTANVNGIQQSTVPVIIEMEHIHAWLSDADRSAADAYLIGGAQNAPSQLQYDANIAGTNLDVLGRMNAGDPQLRYEADIAAASRELQIATEQNLGGSGASQHLQAVAAAIGNYTRLIQTASVDEGPDPTAGIVYLQAASNLMHGPGGILAQVDATRGFFAAGLDQANLNVEIAAGMLVLYVVIALAVLVLLVRTQHFVRARFRRRRNNRLLAATLLLVVALVGTGAGATQATQAIRAGESQSYARLLNLWNARALLYDANANESLVQIAPDGRGQFDQAFRLETTQLVDRPLTDQQVLDAGRGQIGFGGLFAGELSGSASNAEKASAMHILRAYRAFLQADAAVRAAPSTPGGAGASPAAARAQAQLASSFTDLDWYLGVSIQMVQQDFDSTMGVAALTLAATASLGFLALAIVGLTFWGLQPRMNEYTAGSKRR